MSYQNKYIKYKNKYLDLKNQIGGSTINDARSASSKDVESICGFCLESFNNIDRKPVGLHGTINSGNITTSPEHFVCTRCYHYNHDTLSKKCPGGCGIAIVIPEKIYDYDINTHRIAKPLSFILYNEHYILPSNSSCSLCAELYNNEDKKPVGLHDKLNYKKVLFSSDQHFVCLKCYNKNISDPQGVRKKCVVCKQKIVDFDAQIYNYNIEDKIVSDEKLGFVLVKKFFKRIDAKCSRESGCGGGNSGRPEIYDPEYKHFQFVCTCNNPNPKCDCINNTTTHKLINKKLNKEDYDKLDVHESLPNITSH